MEISSAFISPFTNSAESDHCLKELDDLSTVAAVQGSSLFNDSLDEDFVKTSVNTTEDLNDSLCLEDEETQVIQPIDEKIDSPFVNFELQEKSREKENVELNQDKLSLSEKSKENSIPLLPHAAPQVRIAPVFGKKKVSKKHTESKRSERTNCTVDVRSSCKQLEDCDLAMDCSQERNNSQDALKEDKNAVNLESNARSKPIFPIQSKEAESSVVEMKAKCREVQKSLPKPHLSKAEKLDLKEQKEKEKKAKKAEKERAKEERKLALEQKKAEREQKKIERDLKKMEKKKKTDEKHKKKVQEVAKNLTVPSIDQVVPNASKEVRSEKELTQNNKETTELTVKMDDFEPEELDKGNGLVMPEKTATVELPEHVEKGWTEADIESKKEDEGSDVAGLQEVQREGDCVGEKVKYDESTRDDMSSQPEKDSANEAPQKKKSVVPSFSLKIKKISQSKDSPSPALKQEKEKSNSTSKGKKRAVAQPSSVWVQCDHPECLKWRLLRDINDPSRLPDKWYCSMNKDSEHNSCSANEEAWSDPDEYSEYIYSPYNLGSIVWAKLDGYPWWPAMIDNDPDEESYYETSPSSSTPVRYHVVFFDKPVSRGWIHAVNMHQLTMESKITDFGGEVPVKYQNSLSAAVERAHGALQLSLVDRLKKFGFKVLYRRDRKRSHGEQSEGNPRRLKIAETNNL